MTRDRYTTEQEAFWAGSFGDEYARRNRDPALHASNLAFFSRALAKAARIESCLEIGANIGMNLSALATLYPGQRQFAVEINHSAAQELRHRLPAVTVIESSILDVDLSKSLDGETCDLVLTKGALIHVNPDRLGAVYAQMVAAARRYVLVCEYYNPTATSVEYRGHSERLFKRDFAGELMSEHPFLELIDYGFAYRRDRAFPQDDITWFLMEKTTSITV